MSDIGTPLMWHFAETKNLNSYTLLSFSLTEPRPRACDLAYTISFADCTVTVLLPYEMKDVPICLQRHYHALDDLISALSDVALRAPMVEDCTCGCKTYHGIKLMCDVWKIIKEDPKQTQIMDPNEGHKPKENELNSALRLLNRSCYKGCRCSHRKVEGSSSGQKKSCCQKPDQHPDPISGPSGVVGSVDTGGSTVVTETKDDTNFFERDCTAKVDNLLQTEEQLKIELGRLEQREKKGMELLKKADGMWVYMEEAYKKKLSELTKRNMAIEKELNDLEVSTKKWRKNMKDLESELNRINKVEQETKEKFIQKNSDIKCTDLEIAGLKKRLENSKKEAEATKKSYSKKKETSDKRIANLDTEVKKLEKTMAEENKKKRDKEFEGSKFIKDAREDFQKISGLLLKKKLENENFKAQKESLLSDIDMLVQVRDTCKDRCEYKEKSLEEDIKNIDEEVAKNKNKCLKCNKCIDTSEFHRFCTDCPNCVEERRCFIEGDHCDAGPALDCVCVAMKKKFLDNVFENMYTVLGRLVYKGRGKMVGDQVLECLRKSRNGKLDEKTRKSVQTFILSGVKKHLNLTIIGGAVKTRCEMEPETYKKLMDCLKKVKTTTISKEDKGTISKKEPCPRWGGVSECYCPNGPKGCICTTKAPPPHNEPIPCPEEDEDDQDKDNVDSCPDKQNLTCNCDEAPPTVDVDKELSESKPEPCKGSTCKYAKNMRTAPYAPQPDESAATNGKECCTSIPIKIVPSLKEEDFCDCMMPTGYSRSYADTKNIKLNVHISKILKSPSSALVIAFKKDFIENIRKELKMTPLSNIVIKDATSGCITIQLTPDEKEFNVDRTMLLENISSGCVCFEENDIVLKLINEARSVISPDNRYFCSQCDKMQTDAILRETPSAVALVIPREPLNLIKNRLIGFNRPKTYSNVKVLYSDDTVIQFPGVLKSTSSHNYLLTVDKEYEKNFRATVNNYIRDDSEITATIRKSISNSYLVKLGCPDITPDTNIAVLNKTRSGNIKIIVNDSKIKKLRAKLRCKSPEVVNLTKCCTDLLKTLNNRNTYHITMSQNLCKRCERFGYEKTLNKTENAHKEQYHFHSSLLEKSSVALNKKSKEVFIDRLKKYLTDPSKSLHLRKTISNNAILVIERGISNNSLIVKITPSGNLYVLPNKQRDKNNSLVQCSVINLINDYAYSKTYTDNKLVGSYDCLTSQDTIETSKSFSDKSKVGCNTGKQVLTEESSISEYDTKLPLIGNTYSTESGKIMDYIVIKPTPKLSCIYHTDAYDVSSLDDVLSACGNDRIQGKTTNTGENNSGWDSLSFLPPQLPSFLDDVKHLYN